MHIFCDNITYSTIENRFVVGNSGKGTRTKTITSTEKRSACLTHAF